MRASDLRHTVIHETPLHTEDDHGGTTETWQLVNTIYAKIEPIDGGQSIDFDRNDNNRRYLLTTRNRGISISSEDRLLWGNKMLLPDVAINSDSIGHWLEFEAHEEL